MKRNQLLLSALAAVALCVPAMTALGAGPVAVPASSADSGTRSVVAIDQANIYNNINNVANTANYAVNLGNNANNTANYAVDLGNNAYNTANYAVNVGNNATNIANYATSLAQQANGGLKITRMWQEYKVIGSGDTQSSVFVTVICYLANGGEVCIDT